MKAEIGKTYAQILNGKCHWIFTSDDLPEWNENDILTVDVTGNVPAVGWQYVDGVFAPEAAPDEAVAVNAVMSDFVGLRERAVNWLNSIAGRAQRANDIETAQACDAAASALISMTNGLTSTTATTRLAELNARYLTILAGLPDPVQQAFNALKP